MVKIVLTGGLGNIGIAVAQKLILDGHNLVIYDVDPKNNYLFESNPQVQIINGDIRDFDKLSNAVIGAHGIIHLAAVSRVVWGFENPSECVDININGTNNVYEAARISARKPWIIFGSSREVYGEPDELPCKEKADKVVANVYGVTKTTGENLLEQYCKNYGLSGIVLRFSNVYGSVYDQMDRVIPKFLIRASKGLPLELQGGKQIFDFTHISDTVQGIVNSVNLLIKLNYDNTPYFDDFHILTGEATTLLSLAEEIQNSFVNKVDIIYTPARSYDVEKFYGDTSKSKEILGYKPKISIINGIKLMIDVLKADYLSDKNPLKDI